MSDELEAGIWKLTQPLNGQYPRPWMTKLRDPANADVFVVGKNPSRNYPTDRIGAQSRHVDALFNRNRLTCRGLYDEIAGVKGPSPTRKNIDRLVEQLNAAGVEGIVETNAICYSTPTSTDLFEPIHRGGSQRGGEIFDFLLAMIRPRVLIVHGKSTFDRFKLVLPGKHWPAAPTRPDDKVAKGRPGRSDYNPLVYPIPSLAPPGFYQNKWNTWCDEYFQRLAADVAAELSSA